MMNMLEQHVSGAVDHNYRLWLLLNLELWHRMYIEGQSFDDIRQVLENSLVAGNRT